jgi:hypothetical protein
MLTLFLLVIVFAIAWFVLNLITQVPKGFHVAPRVHNTDGDTIARKTSGDPV